MKLALILSLRVAGFPFTGCATSFRAPSDVAHLKLKRVSSPVVAFEKIWLERKKGPLVVTGYVVKRLEAEGNEAKASDLAMLLLEQAQVAEGAQLEDPSAFVRRMNRILLG